MIRMSNGLVGEEAPSGVGEMRPRVGGSPALEMVVWPPVAQSDSSAMDILDLLPPRLVAGYTQASFEGTRRAATLKEPSSCSANHLAAVPAHAMS